MAATSLEAVKRKIKLLQEQADGAEEKAEKLQRDLALERKARETVRTPHYIKCEVHVLKGDSLQCSVTRIPRVPTGICSFKRSRIQYADMMMCAVT